MKKKIANVVLNNFTNDSRVWKTSLSMAFFGHEPVVVALYDVGLRQRDTVGGVEVQRIKLASRPWPKWRLIQAFKYLEFLFRAFFRYRNVDVVHCNDLNALPIGILIKIFGNNVKVVYDCHEYETEINGLKGVEKVFKKWLERKLIVLADEVLTVSGSIADEYVRLYDLPRPNLLLNCPNYRDQPKCNFFREHLNIRPDQTIFLYQGGLSKGRGIELLLEAFSGLDSDKNVLVFMGYGPFEEFIHRYANEVDVIFFHSAVSPDVLLDYTSSADYGISFIEDSCLSYRYCLPNKMFEYLMAGLPVLTSNLFEMKRFVEAEGVGIVADSNTVEGFREAVAKSLAQDYAAVQENVFRVRRKYCWEQQENVLRDIYNEL